MTPKLAIERVTKTYGKVFAIDDVTLNVPVGCTFGLLGRNGAGKTTTFNCALGLTRPDNGRVRFDGLPLSPDALHGIAYVPERPALDSGMTGAAYVSFHKRIYHHFDTARARAIADLFEVPLRRPIGKLSRGEKSSVALALAFAQRASLLILDEPSAGLDPYLQLRLLDLIVRECAEGTTILIASHDIGQIERVAENIAIVDRGRIVADGNLDELRSAHKILEAPFARAPQLTSLKRHAAVSRIDERGAVVRVHVHGDAGGVADALAEMGATSVRTVDRSLEDIFLATVSPAESERA